MDGSGYEFRLLGPLEVRWRGTPLRIGGYRLRAVLTVLILHAGEAVSTDRLVDDVWASRAPAGAVGTMHTYVSRLRKALGPEAGRVLGTSRNGYALTPDPEAVDVTRFEHLVAEGRRATDEHSWSRAAEAYRQALELWRGPALAEVADQPFARSQVTRLEELRLLAAEGSAEAELALGHHDDLVVPLQREVARHPLRERLAGQLMLALYRSDRQADALAEYARLRRTLADELGIDPAPALHRLRDLILRQDSSLDRSPTGPARPSLPPPRVQQLPARHPAFVGREALLDRVGALLRQRSGRGTGAVALHGLAGVGKTSVALEYAHRVRDAYDVVWWVPAGDPAVIGATFARLGEQLLHDPAAPTSAPTSAPVAPPAPPAATAHAGAVGPTGVTAVAPLAAPAAPAAPTAAAIAPALDRASGPPPTNPPPTDPPSPAGLAPLPALPRAVGPDAVGTPGPDPLGALAVVTARGPDPSADPAVGTPDRAAPTAPDPSREEVLRALAARGRWLLVFDGAERVDDVAGYVPAGNGDVVITSVSPAWRRMAVPLPVGVFARPESVAHLRRTTGSADSAAADRLAGLLGDLPLALVQAAEYAEQTGLGLDAYASLLGRHDALLARGAPADHPESVSTSLRAALARAADAAPTAADLLVLCAFLAPAPVDLALLAARADDLPAALGVAVHEELLLNDVVAALLRRSLVERDGDRIAVHPLVATVTLSTLTPDERCRWAALAGRLREQGRRSASGSR